MHSYQHNIKTFNSATRHLTRVERSLYRDLIELYYDTEQPLPADDFDRLARRVLAISEEEKEALRFVLGEFFELTGDVYTHDYCDDQIEKFHAATTAKARAGKASAEARRKRANERKGTRQAKAEQDSTVVEQALNRPSTAVPNQKPVTSNNNKHPYPDDFEKIWNSFTQEFGEKGSKKKAHDEYKKLKTQLPDNLIDLINQQHDAKRQAEMAGQFVAPFQHVERWLKNRRWEDDIDPGGVPGNGDWRTSWSGIQAKAQELGIAQNDGEQNPEFKQRVFEAAENHDRPH